MRTTPDATVPAAERWFEASEQNNDADIQRLAAEIAAITDELNEHWRKVEAGKMYHALG